MIELEQLIDAQVHFGHKTSRWNPHMLPYIWGSKSGVHVINIAKTRDGIERAAQFLKGIAEQGKQVLLVGTKKAAQKAVTAAAQEAGMPYVASRWVGGTITNFAQVRKSFAKLQHLEDVLVKSAEFSYTKKELNVIQKNVERLKKNIGGVVTLRYPLGAVVLVDIRKEQTALREARAAGVPVVALVDTNNDPLLVDYVIPANDDSPKSIELIVNYLGQAVKDGAALAREAMPAQQMAADELTLDEPSLLLLEEEEELEGSRTKKAAVRNNTVKANKTAPTAGAKKMRGPRK